MQLGRKISLSMEVFPLRMVQNFPEISSKANLTVKECLSQMKGISMKVVGRTTNFMAKGNLN